MKQPCQVCGYETDYENKLCGPCFNAGLRGRTQDGLLIIEVNTFAHYRGLVEGDGGEQAWLNRMKEAPKRLNGPWEFTPAYRVETDSCGNGTTYSYWRAEAKRANGIVMGTGKTAEEAETTLRKNITAKEMR